VVKSLQEAQKLALQSNGLGNALALGVPRLHIPDSSSSDKTEVSDELMPTHLSPRYELPLPEQFGSSVILTS